VLVASTVVSVKQRSGVRPSVCLSVCLSHIFADVDVTMAAGASGETQLGLTSTRSTACQLTDRSSALPSEQQSFNRGPVQETSPC